jgi:hypothetical protein
MQRSSDRILTIHVGRLSDPRNSLEDPRPCRLLSAIKAEICSLYETKNFYEAAPRCATRPQIDATTHLDVEPERFLKEDPYFRADRISLLSTSSRAWLRSRGRVRWGLRMFGFSNFSHGLAR